MNKYKSKLAEIKSKRLNAFSRLRHLLYFISLIAFSYLLLIAMLLGLNKLFIVGSILDSMVKFYFFWSFLFIVLLGFLFILFKLIGFAFENLTTSLSGISKSTHSRNHSNTTLKFYWLVYSLIIFCYLFIILWEEKYNYNTLFIILFEIIIFSGLISFSYQKPLISKAFWKAVFFIQLVEVLSVIMLNIYTPFFIYNFRIASDIFRFLMLCFFIFILVFIPIYGIWKYSFKSESVWSK